MNYYTEIKNELITNEITKRVKDYYKNKSDLNTYYNVGKLLSEAGNHYGEGIIKEYSKKLIAELNKKYSTRLLYKMRKFYSFINNQKVPTLSAKLSWSHYDEILSLDNSQKINYYIHIVETQHIAIRELRQQRKDNEYERLPQETKDNYLSKIENTNISDFIKNPIIIKSNTYEEISEKALQKIIIEDIENFMKELGNLYSFIGSEYKIKIGNKYNYIDLLFYNIEYNCYVIIELKVTELKKEHIGQIEIYMNYIDKNIKKDNQDKTIGIILCKKDNKLLMEYCSDSRILSREYLIIN